jgi:hypothetical protein
MHYWCADFSMLKSRLYGCADFSMLRWPLPGEQNGNMKYRIAAINGPSNWENQCPLPQQSSP